MKKFVKLSFYIYHPLWMAFLGAVLYFLITPRQFYTPIVEAKLFALLILTVFIPLLFLFMLSRINLLEHFEFKNLKARRLYIIGLLTVFVSVNNFIIDPVIPELYYFYSGLIFALGASFLGVLFNFKACLHCLHLSALLGFTIGLSLLYNLQTQALIALFIFGIGWSCTERLQTKKHSKNELLTAFLFGFVPQIIFFGNVIIRYKF